MTTHALFLITLLSLLQVTQAVVSYHVPKAQIQFLDEFCRAVQCKNSPLFKNWDFTKDVAGEYTVSPCQALPTGPTDPQAQQLWPYVSCTYESLLLGQTHASANVTTLLQNYPINYPTYKLQGTIPESISGMVALKVLSIGGQKLFGPLPAGLGQCTALETLDLHDNRLSGALPGAQLAKLTRLTQLILNGNLFSGQVAFELAAMTKLTDLNLIDNKLTGLIPSELALLTGLTALQLGENSLRGPIPTTIYSMNHLLRLDLDNNQLSGELSPSLAELFRMHTLELSNNQFSGTIPAAMYSMTNLTTLAIGHNKLTGGLSSAIGQLTKLQELTLGANMLGGQLPAELSKLTALVSFDYAYNGYSGAIPTMFNSSSLQTLELGGNPFSGGIPNAVFFPSLTKLSLENCGLTGSIPPAVADMPMLHTLYLDQNKLEGTMPSEMGRMSRLQILSLNSNKLSGAFGLCDLGETISSITMTENSFNCYSSCWIGEAALTAEGIPSCDFCPRSQYTTQVPVNSRNPAEGTMSMCAKCPVGYFSFGVGEQSIDACSPCPHNENPVGQVNPQCNEFGFQGRNNVKMGSPTFNVIAYLFSFSIAGLFAIFSIFVYRARNNCVLTVRVPFLVIVGKMAAYGFIIFADFILAIALLTSFVYDKFGAVLLVMRLSHFVISLRVLMKTYEIAPASSLDLLQYTEQGSKVTKEPRRIKMEHTFMNMIDQEGLSDPKTTNIFVGMAILCMFDSQLLQFMPWRFTREASEHCGFPDGNTYFMLGIWKFMQSCMSMICMMNYLGGVSEKALDSAGIDGMFALNISITTGLLLFSVVIEPLICNLKATADALTMEAIQKEKEDAAENEKRASFAAGGAVKRTSVFVDAGSVYGEGSDDIVEMAGGSNPMQLGAEPPAPKSKALSRTPSDGKLDKSDKVEKHGSKHKSADTPAAPGPPGHHHHNKDKVPDSPKKAPPAPPASVVAAAPTVPKKFTPPARPAPAGPGAPPPTRPAAALPGAPPAPGAPPSRPAAPPPGRPGPPPPAR